MSLDLDKRQRAMLREMGVQVWQAVSPTAAEAAAMPPTKVALQAPAEPVGFTVSGAGVAQHRPEHRVVAPPVATASRAFPASALAASPSAAGVVTQGPRPDASAMDWAALQTAVAGCRACRLCESRRNTVFGVGPTLPGSSVAPSVDWLIVGEAPGENEDAAGEPFVGQAGKLLDNMLRAVGLQRGMHEPDAAGLSHSVFIANVLKCRPPANRNPEPAEVAQCEPYLKRQIELLQPKVILAMGKFAAQSLLQPSVEDVHKIPLGKLRGRVHRYLGVPVVVTYHPAYLLRSLPDKAKAWDDLCLAMENMAPTVAHCV